MKTAPEFLTAFDQEFAFYVPRRSTLIDRAGHRHATRADCCREGCDLEALWENEDGPLCDEHALADAVLPCGQPSDFDPPTELWMRAIPASQAHDYGVVDDDCDDTVLRNQTTGKFEARMIWITCPEGSPGAEPFYGLRWAGG